MKEQRLTEYLKEGYPLFKERSGMSPWIVPQRSFAVVVDSLGDAKLLDASRCIGLLPETVQEITGGGFSAGIFRQTCLDWPHFSIVGEIIISLLRSGEQLMERHYHGKLSIEPQVIFRSLMVIAFAPFVPQGRAVLKDVAAILDGNVANPGDLVIRYASAVLADNLASASSVNSCIANYNDWACWADYLQQAAMDFNGNYKLVAVTPPLSDRLVDVLVDMIKEAPNYGA